MNKFYVYLHSNADTGEVFYVGKGKGPRAWSKQRNNLWKTVTKHCNYSVVIVKDGLEEDEALQMEAQLISEYRSLGQAVANIADGGECPSQSVRTGVKKQELREFVKRFGKFPSRYKDGEKALQLWLQNYCNPASGTFDSDFREEMVALGYGKDNRQSRKHQKQAQIVEFINSQGRFPSSVIEEEKKLRVWLGAYTNKTQTAYDKSFDEEMRKLGLGSGSGTVHVCEGESNDQSHDAT